MDSPKFLSRLRLQAAVSMMHLATVPKFAEVLQPKFLRLAVTIQVSFTSVLAFALFLMVTV